MRNSVRRVKLSPTEKTTILLNIYVIYSITEETEYFIIGIHAKYINIHPPLTTLSQRPMNGTSLKTDAVYP